MYVPKWHRGAMRNIAAIEGRGESYMGTDEAIDTAKAVMRMTQGKVTDTEREVLQRSRGAVTLLTAIEGHNKAWESVKKAAGEQLRVRNVEYGVRSEETIPQSDGTMWASSPTDGEVAKIPQGEYVRYKYTGKTSEGIKKYVTDFPKDMDHKTREKVFKERIATVFNLGAVKLNTDTKKIRILGDKFTVQKNIHGDKVASDVEMSAKINSLYDIADILSDSQYVSKNVEPSFEDSALMPKNKAHKDVKYWYKFKNTISMDGEIYDVIFNVRDKGKEQYQYLIEFHKKGDNSNQPYSPKDLRRTLDELSPKNRISQNSDTVNTNSMQEAEVYSQGERVEIPDGSRIVKNVVLDEESMRVRRRDAQAYKNVEILAQDLRMRVKYVSNLTDSTGTPLDGVITSQGIFINSDAENPSRFAATHEFSHRMKQAAPETWQRYQNFVTEKLQKDGRYENIFKGKAAAYNNSNADYINEEIAADYIGELFGNEAELAEFIKDSRRNAVTIRDIWYGILDKLGLLDEKKKAQLMWRNVYKAAVLNVEKGNVGEFGEIPKYALCKDAATEVEKAITNKYYDKEVKLTESSPAILTSQKGVRNLPMMMVASHIRENILTEEEAKKLGLKVNSGINYHGLGKDLFLKVINGLDGVTEAYRGTKNAEKSERRENYFLLISQYEDTNGDTINVPVYVNEHGVYNRIFVDTNKIATVFGRNELRTYLKKQLADGNLVRIKNRSTQASESQSPIDSDYSKNASTDSIRNFNEKVKQNGENDAKKSVSGARISDIGSMSIK